LENGGRRSHRPDERQQNKGRQDDTGAGRIIPIAATIPFRSNQLKIYFWYQKE
jgi:hypothetical protein